MPQDWDVDVPPTSTDSTSPAARARGRWSPVCQDPARATRRAEGETVAFDILFPTRGGHDDDVNAGESHCSTAEGIVEQRRAHR